MKVNNVNILISYIAVLGTIFLLVSCGKSSVKDTAHLENDGTTLRVISSAEVPSIDSTKSYDTVSSNVISNIQSALYRTNEENEIEPDLAKSLPKISADGKTYIVEIKPNLKFSNGTPIKADNFVYAAQRLFDPKTASQAAGSYYDILNSQEVNEQKKDIKDLGVKALDENTLEIKLKAPNPTFTRTIASIVLAPLSEKFINEQGKDYAKTDKNILSSGPYVLKNWDTNSLKWSFEKNDNYWNAKRVEISNVDVSVVKDESTAVNLFESGKIDYSSLSGEYISKYKDNPGYHSVNVNRVTNLEMGISSNPVLQNKHFRKALFQSINRDDLIKYVLKDSSKSLYNPVPINLQSDPKSKKDFSTISDEKAPKYDLKDANEEWKIAKKELGKETVELELLTDDGDSSKKLGEYIQSQIETNLPGVKINVSVVTAKVRFQKMMEYKFDLAVGGWSGDIDPISFIQQFYSTYEHNHGKIKDDELDKNIDLARTDYALDETKRFESLQKANKILTDNAYVIPLYQSSSSIVVNPKLTGFEYKTGFDFTFARFKQ